MSENSVFRTTYIHEQTVKTMISLKCIVLSWSKPTKISDNSNNVHFSDVRFICSPYLAFKADNDKMRAANEP